MALRDFLKRTANRILTGQNPISAAVSSATKLGPARPATGVTATNLGPARPATGVTATRLPAPPAPLPNQTSREPLPGEIAVDVSSLPKPAPEPNRAAAAMKPPTASQKDGTVTKDEKPPEGATLISGPSGLAGLTESQIWRASNGDVYRLAGATEGAGASGGAGTGETASGTSGTQGGAKTGPTDDSSQTDPAAAQRAALRKKVTDLTGPSAETQEEKDLAAIQGRIAGIEAQAGLRKAEAGEQAIETGFVTGQQAAIERRAAALSAVEAAKAVPLQTRLAQAQARRAQERDAAALELGFTEADIAEKKAAADAAAKAKEKSTQTVKPGETIVEIQPDGTAKTVYSAPEEAKKRETQIVNIGGKATVVDKQTGEIISVVGPAGKGTGGAGGGGGSTGTYTGKLSPVAESVMKNPALLNNFTPTERGKILSELAQSGQDLSGFTVEKLSAGQRDQIALFDEIENEAIAANGLIGSQNLGPIISRAKSLGAAFGLAPADFTDLRSSINNMSSVLLRMRSGAAVTPQEYERIRGFIPEINDDEKTAKRKASRFLEEIGKAKANYIVRATQTSQEILASVGQKGFTPQAGGAGGAGIDDLDFTMTE